MAAPPSQSFESEVCSGSLSRLGVLSIHGRARRHPRLKVLVEPLFWTQLQLQLLRCAFTGPFPASKASMELSYPGDARRQAKFEWLFRNGSRTGAIRCLIGGSEVPLQFFLDLYFSLGGYRPIKLPCSYFCLRNECERDFVGEVLAIAAHIDCKHIAWMRNMSNTRTRLDRLRPRRFVPKDPLHEPYLVALLIALAQRQWRALRRKTKQQEICVKSQVLSSSDNPDVLHFYTTYVTSTLLRMFKDPNVIPPVPQSLSIQITAIPYRPIATLRNRLTALLLSASNLDEVSDSKSLVVCK